MKQILALAASNKRVSINQTLLHVAVSKLVHLQSDILSLSEIDLPVYNEEMEHDDGIPELVMNTYRRFAAADGFMLACPEHNGLPPAAFKNLFDWMSRVSQQVFQMKPVMLLSTSPGLNGGASNLLLLKELLPRWGGESAGIFTLGNFYQHFNFNEMALNDPSIDNQLTNEVNLFESSVLSNE